METPSPQHRKLAQLVGTWSGEEKVEPSQFSPKGSTAKGTFEGRLAADEFCLVIDYVHDDASGGISLRAHAVVRWDADKQRYVQHWFDRFGYFEGHGTWEGDALSFEFPTHRTCYTLSGTSLVVRADGRDGNSWKLAQEGTLRRSQK